MVNQAAKANDWRHTKILLDIIRDIERQAEPASPATSSGAGSTSRVIYMPDNGRDPELTEERRKAQEEYFARTQRR